MTAIDWTAEFCLGCDTQTDGAAYCSEACRLLEFEKTSASSTSSSVSTPSSSMPSSPSFFAAPAYPWTFQHPSATSMSSAASPALRLCPASNSLEFRHRAISSIDNSYQSGNENTLSLTPSSSHSSLCSMQTTTSMSSLRTQTGPDSVVISDRASRELREYAMSLEYVKLHRRRSY